MRKSGQKKSCWIARESKKGWTLTYNYGLEKRSLGVYFGSPKHIKQALGCPIIFVCCAKDSKQKK